MAVPADLSARASALIGVPWVAKGTSPVSGWDCLGLAYWCLREWCGVTVPSYQERYEAACFSPLRREERARLLAEGMGDWREVSPQAGAVARLRWMGRVGHVGFMLTPTLILHADVTCGTALLDLSSPAATYRLAGAFVPACISQIVTA